jgi:UDP-N-acetylglucosamine 1-carboxyvinyltransferase
LTKDLLPFSISTGPHPGFPTDLQSPTSLLAAVGRGKSKIHETMYENRLAYINELKKMGLNATLTSAHRVEITGPTKFHATKISSLDLRSGITMLLAGLMADGTTIVEKAEIIDRGYERVEEKLRSLGAQIERVK